MPFQEAVSRKGAKSQRFGKPKKDTPQLTPLGHMRFSRNQIIGTLIVLGVIWLVIAIRLIIAR